MTKNITATYKTNPVELSLSATQVAAEDTVEIQGLPQGQSGSLAWQPSGLFTMASPQTVNNGDKLVVSSSAVGTYQLMLTVGSESPGAYLRAGPGSFSAVYDYALGSLGFLPLMAAASPNDVLDFSMIKYLDGTLSWDGTKSIFKDITGTSTPVTSSSQLVVASSARGRYQLTLAGQGSRPGRGFFYVRATSLHYNNSSQLGFIPTPYVNKGDQVIIDGLPSGYSATLSWSAEDLFVGYQNGGTNVPVENGKIFTVSNSGSRAPATLILKFSTIPPGGAVGGADLSRAGGTPDVTPIMATGTLDPTGDGDVER